MDSEKKHIIYTAEEIQKYMKGRLTPAEMHAMEKAALDDAFLAEAMEGYAGMDEKDWDSQLILLKDNFSKGQTAKVIALKPARSSSMWKAAAAVLIICCGFAIKYIFTTNEPSQNKSIATINLKQDSVISTVAQPGSVDTPSATISTITTKTKTKAPAQTLFARSEKKALADSAFMYRPGTVDKPEIKQTAGGGYVDDQLKGRNDISSNNQAPSTLQNNLKQYNKSNNKLTNQSVTEDEGLKKIEASLTRKFTALVVGQDGAPLPFANISIPNENFGTYADAKGNIRLVSHDSLLNIEIKSVGFITRRFTLSSDIPQNKIVLAEDELALEEKTLVLGKVPGPGKKRSAVFVPDSVNNVEPEDGWNNYDTYITNNLSLSNDILQKKIHGEVGVSFEVQSDGAISNVKIDKSLCNDCDEEALRVIKEGPHWKVKNGNQATAKVKVKF